MSLTAREPLRALRERGLWRRSPETTGQGRDTVSHGTDATADAGFAEVYTRHVDTIYGFLARRVGPHLAEELTAQTFVEAFAQRDRFDADRGSHSAWLFGIAVNLLRRHYRHEERTLRAIAALAGRSGHGTELLDEDGTADRVVAEDRWPDVAEALLAMAPGERDALLLHAWAELPYSAIAAVLDIPIGTVRSRLNRARSRLTAILDPSLETDGTRR